MDVSCRRVVSEQENRLDSLQIQSSRLRSQIPQQAPSIQRVVWRDLDLGGVAPTGSYGLRGVSDISGDRRQPKGQIHRRIPLTTGPVSWDYDRFSALEIDGNPRSLLRGKEYHQAE